MKGKEQPASKRMKGWIVALSLLFVGLQMLPIYSALLGSFMPFEEIGSGALLPKALYLDNYVQIWHRAPLGRYLLNSVVYSLSVSTVVLVLSAPSAYSISRFRFTGKSVYLTILLITQVIPVICIVVPLFLLIVGLGLFDSYAAVILVLTAIALPVPVLLLRGYFDTIPLDLDNAALLDGCSRLKALAYVIMPAAAPALFSVLILTFSLVWQQFLIPLIFLSSSWKLPVTVATYNVYTESIVPWNLVMTISVISIIPPVLVFFIAQKYVIKGFTMGALK